MGFSIIKKIKILPGLNLNLSTSGVGISAGPSGVKINKKLVGKNIGRTTAYASKYGVRYTQTLKKKK
ncbi:MAG: DUF4236 domain-containing protein [Candidatus Micrarchaeota archaeon]|nr:DUF4236 domain-containing protein [Candidatus Micrarchaeota archaeon]